jgi:hypothetical protein
MIDKPASKTLPDQADPRVPPPVTVAGIGLILAVGLTGCSDDGAADGGGGSGAGQSASDAAGPAGQTNGAGPSTTGTGATTSASGTASTGSANPLPVGECDTPDPDWIFCSGFEEGNKDIWDDYDGNPDQNNLLMEDGGPFDNAGNHVMRIRVDPGRNGADLVKLLPSSHDKLYARWYIQYEPGFDFNAPNHGGGLHAGSRDLLGHSDTQPNGNDWYTAWVEPLPPLQKYNIYSYYPGMYMDCSDPDGSCWGDHFPCMMDDGSNYCTNPAHQETIDPPVLETGKWYCIELMLDGGTPTPSAEGASGAIGLSIDGVELGPWESLWMRSSEDLDINILWLSLFHHEEHSIEGVFYDHVVVSTSPIGCWANRGDEP